MITYPMRISTSERNLILAIRELQYGEFTDLELDGDSQPPIYEENLTGPQKGLLELIRNGNRFFYSLKIHQCDPAYALVPYTTKYGGFRARKLHKLN